MWLRHGHLREGRRWLERFLAASEANPPARLKALLHAGGLAVLAGDEARGAGFAEEALALARDFGDREAAGIALLILGQRSQLRGEQERAKRLREEALVLFREVGATGWVATQLD